MREIKYRAWHKKYKKMYEVLHLHLNCFEGNWATVKGYNIIEDKDIHIQIQPKDIELMHYTGLKDKNGTEIFERDILKSTYPNVYNEDGLEIHTGKVIFSPHNGYGVAYDDGNYGFIFEDKAEVIGNVYEDKHLLENSI